VPRRATIRLEVATWADAGQSLGSRAAPLAVSVMFPALPTEAKSRSGVGMLALRGREELIMFVQVIKGKVSDPTAFRAALTSWLYELAPGATGWRGSTTGVTDDGTLIAVARFDNEDNARRNSDRPEQAQWWTETKRLFDDEVTIENSVDVDDYVVGDPDTAGFVQVMQGQVSDLDWARDVMQQRPDNLEQLRPDILAILNLAHKDGRWTSVVYFTSEADARQRESQDPPTDFAAMMQGMASLSVGETTYYDLRQVWLASPPTARTQSMFGVA